MVMASRSEHQWTSQAARHDPDDAMEEYQEQGSHLRLEHGRQGLWMESMATALGDLQDARREGKPIRRWYPGLSSMQDSSLGSLLSRFLYTGGVRMTDRLPAGRPRIRRKPGSSGSGCARCVLCLLYGEASH